MVRKKDNITPKFTRKQPTNKVEALVRLAEDSRSTLQKYTADLAERLGLDPEFAVERGPLKEIKRIFQKANGRLGGEIDRVCDISRMRIYVDSPEQIEEFRRLFGPNHSRFKFNRNWATKGTRKVRVNPFEQIRDYYAKPRDTGYVGINMNVTLELGKGKKTIAEIQIQHKDMKQIDTVSHAIFESIRDIKETAKIEKRSLTKEEKAYTYDLLEQNKKLYEDACEKLGLTKLRKQGVDSYYNGLNLS